MNTGSTKNLKVKFTIPEFLQKDDPACSTVDPEIFFPQEIQIGSKIVYKYPMLSKARDICSGCPLKIECLQYAMNNVEFGVWGGTTESQREQLRKSSRITANRRKASPDLW